MLRVQGLRVKRGNFLLEVDFFEMDTHEFVIILGPSGSGKTTFLEAIAGFIKPLEGKITFYGNDISNLPPWERNISIVYQDPYLFPHFTVKENLLFGKRACEKFVLTLSERLGIVDLLERYPHQLSAGQRQRVSIIRALAARPLMILMDEPFNYLDPLLKEEFRILLKEIREEFLMPIILVTHDLEEALFSSDKIAIMQNGRITHVGTPFSVVKNPPDGYVAKFLGNTNFLPLEKREGGFYFGEQMVRLPYSPARDNVIAILRPQDIILSDVKPEHLSARNILEGEVVEILRGQKVNEVKVSINGNLLKAYITDASLEELNLKPGSKVFLAFKATALCILD